MLKIEKLTTSHDRNSFDCGDYGLNQYLQRTARQHAEKGVSQTRVLIDTSAPTEILGFYTLSLCAIEIDTLPGTYQKGLPDSGNSGVLLGRLAVSAVRHRQGLGKLMMVDAMRATVTVADKAGITGVFVDAKDETAAVYYEQYGFIALPSNALRAFLPLPTLVAAFS